MLSLLKADVQAYGELASDLVVVGAVYRSVEHCVGRQHRIAVQRVADGAEQPGPGRESVPAVKMNRKLGGISVLVNLRVARPGEQVGQKAPR